MRRVDLLATAGVVPLEFQVCCCQQCECCFVLSGGFVAVFVAVVDGIVVVLFIFVILLAFLFLASFCF